MTTKRAAKKKAVKKKAAKRPPAKKSPIGRPSEYRPEYAEQARNYCLLGATDADLAVFFEVSETTINNWKLAHPEFLESLKAGKEHADARVADSLYRRATGYEHEAVKITVHAETGATTITPYVERYPPDTTAAIFWLKNRKPEKWRDKQQMELSADSSFADLLREARERAAQRS